MSEWRKAFERLSGQIGEDSVAPSFVSKVSFVSHPPYGETGRGGEIPIHRLADKADKTDKTPPAVPLPLQRGADKADKTDKTVPEQSHNLSASNLPPQPCSTRAGAIRGDPPAPVVNPQATRTLAILELAGVAPHLTPDGQVDFAHPEHASPDLRAAAQLHQTDIAALLRYREQLEQLWPVSDAPRPRL